MKELITAIETILGQESDSLPKSGITERQIERFRRLCRFSQSLQDNPEKITVSLNPIMEDGAIQGIDLRVRLSKEGSDV